jgi:hypothetical protein
MRDKRIIRLTGILAAGIATFCTGRLLGSPRPQLEQTARCTLVVPNEWGEYIGAGSYGLEFKDDKGTIRFVKQFSCGLEGAPNVSLEIHRK